MKRHILDQLLAKAVSRKLLVWLVATLMLWFGLLAPGDWLVVAGIYLGIQGATDLVGERARFANSTDRERGALSSVLCEGEVDHE